MRWLAAVLTWFAADPQAIDNERPRAAAACQMAHATMRKVRDDAEQDQDAAAALGEPGGGREAEEGQVSKAEPGKPLHEQGSQDVAAGCSDGSCVAVPRVRQGRPKQSR